MAQTAIPIRTTGDHDLDGVTVKYAWVVTVTGIFRPADAFRLLAQQARAINAQSKPDEVQVRGVWEAVEIAEAVEGMKPGSVIVDLAGETGGNCELTEPGQVVVKHNITIVSPLNLPATMPEHASALYARNLQALIDLVTCLLIAGLGTGSRGSNSHPACSFCSTAWNTGVSVGWEGKSRY